MTAEARLSLIKDSQAAAPAPAAFIKAATDDVRDLHSQLAEAFRPRPGDERLQPVVPVKAKDAPAAAFPLGRLAKVAAALVLAGVFGWRPLSALLTASSVEAVVNARAIELRAPIEGVVAASPAPWSNWSAGADAPALRIENRNADRARLDDFGAERRDLIDRLANAETDLERTLADKAAIGERLKQFLDGRKIKLETRIAAAEVQLDAAKTRVNIASEQEAAYTELYKSKDTSLVDYQRARLATADARYAVSTADAQLRQARLELEALQGGRFLGDDYNDVPVSAQRLDDLDQRIREFESRQRALQMEIVNNQKRIDEESARLDALRVAEIALPKVGRVWEALVAPGEFVTRGQPLMRLLDCSTPEVTATVGESAYNKLHVGGPAKFWPADGGAALDGVIENLTGAADASGNFAIAPANLRKDVRHVTVRVPQLTGAAGCEVGRDGLLTFEGDAAPRAPDVAPGARR